MGVLPLFSLWRHSWSFSFAHFSVFSWTVVITNTVSSDLVHMKQSSESLLSGNNTYFPEGRTKRNSLQGGQRNCWQPHGTRTCFGRNRAPGQGECSHQARTAWCRCHGDTANPRMGRETGGSSLGALDKVLSNLGFNILCCFYEEHKTTKTTKWNAWEVFFAFHFFPSLKWLWCAGSHSVQTVTCDNSHKLFHSTESKKKKSARGSNISQYLVTLENNRMVQLAWHHTFASGYSQVKSFLLANFIWCLKGLSPPSHLCYSKEYKMVLHRPWGNKFSHKNLEKF